MKKEKLNLLIKKYKVQPVGNGYLDCIVVENAVDFVNELSNIGVNVTNISLWCHCTEKHKHIYNCPHGMGGPRSKYYEGWFSEMCHVPLIDVKGNDMAINYITDRIKSEPFYSPCLVPGLWLHLD